MREFIYILITLIGLLSFPVDAQTPYDSFAPETSRPMLGLEDLRAIEASMPSKTQADTLLCAVVIDMQAQRLLLIDVVCGDVIAVAPLTDDLSKWLSVDPMSDKYPGISPYAYCGWNPIRFVDPDGMDDYEVDQSGKVIKQITNKERDAVFIVDADGNRIEGKQIEFEFGSIKKHKSTKDGEMQYDWFEMRGDQNTDELFEFFAKNTTVEWSELLMGISGTNGLGILSTTHAEEKDASISFLLNKRYRYGYTIRVFTHSHPHNTPYPSGLINGSDGEDDMAMASYMTQLANFYGRESPLMYIYLPKSNLYIQYGVQSTKRQFR